MATERTLNVLVAGGAGYIGSHMVKALARAGHAVTVFDNLSTGHADAVRGAALIRGDLRRREDVESVLHHAKFDAVMHFAACCYVGESMQEPRKYYENNVTGSLNLLDAMCAAGVRNLVFSSTCATYGVPQRLPLDETHAQNPVNPYGMTKFAAERAMADYGRAYGLRTIALRYFNAAGCDPEGELGERHDPEPHLIPLVLREALRIRAGGAPEATALSVNGKDFDTADGTCIRDYVHIADLCDAHMLATDRLRRGQAQAFEPFNLGNGRGFSVLEVIQACRAVTGLDIRYLVGDRRPGDPPALVADSSRAHAELGWSPRFVKLEDIVRTAWNWFSARERA
jgi:UDP-glucose-4-epimerase GalE